MAQRSPAPPKRRATLQPSPGQRAECGGADAQAVEGCEILWRAVTLTALQDSALLDHRADLQRSRRAGASIEALAEIKRLLSAAIGMVHLPRFRAWTQLTARHFAIASVRRRRHSRIRSSAAAAVML